MQDNNSIETTKENKRKRSETKQRDQNYDQKRKGKQHEEAANRKKGGTQGKEETGMKIQKKNE